MFFVSQVGQVTALKVKHELGKDSICCLYMKGAPTRPPKSPETASFLPFPHKTHWVADGASFPEERMMGGRRGPNTYSIPLSSAFLQAKGI